MKLLPNSFSGQFFPSLNRAYLCYNYFSREHLYTHDKKKNPTVNENSSFKTTAETTSNDGYMLFLF